MHNLVTNGGPMFERDSEPKLNLVEILQMFSNGMFGSDPLLESLLDRIECKL